MDWTGLGIILAKIIFFLLVGFTTAGYVMNLAERRISAFMQDRWGPNRVGPRGLLQPVADIIKLLFKEDVVTDRSNKVIYFLAPMIIAFTALSALAVIPLTDVLTFFGRKINVQIANLNVGILYIFAIASLGTYGIVLGGWAGNSKYSFLGGLRSSAQMISYEVSMGLSIIGVLMVFGSLRLNDIVLGQSPLLWGFLPRWGVVVQPLAFIIFLTAAFAETNRVPFDLSEADAELVAGFHTEFSSMKFGLFFMAEYINMFTASAVIVALFFGGWQIPGVSTSEIISFFISQGASELLSSLLTILLQMGVTFAKIAFFMFLFVWVRWTIPRFRYDQLMNLGWKGLLPLAILNILITGLVMVVNV
jgi:NADH-quinone oxidoreductase subunit H